jgi:hypothetical protein
MHPARQTWTVLFISYQQGDHGNHDASVHVIVLAEQKNGDYPQGSDGCLLDGSVVS